MPDRHLSEIVVGRNHRVALWCDTDGTFVGNPSSVEETNHMWNEHVRGGDDDDEKLAQSSGQ